MANTDGDDDPRRFVLGVDVGTTNIRAYVYDRYANVIGKAQEKVCMLNLGDGRMEIDPESLWQSFKRVVNECLLNARLNADSVRSMGISTLRGTFLTWNRKTGVPFHNFITWQDKRAEEVRAKWRSSLGSKVYRYAAWFAYLISRKPQYRIASMFNMTSAMVISKLVWVLQKIPMVMNCNSDELLFGTVDTWLVWKLTGGKVHATDQSNASVTGFFDPYQLEWSHLACTLFQIPAHILPTVKCANDSFGETLSEIFGSSIGINAVVGDQQASMFGQCCFYCGDMNCTMGTGTFLDVNTGKTPCLPMNGYYPLVGWTIDGNTTYLAECGISDSGTVISWAENWGIFEDPQEANKEAALIRDSGGVYFVPSFSKLNAEPCSHTSMFVGLKPESTKAHLIRAVLDTLGFQAYSLYETLKNGMDSGAMKLKSMNVTSANLKVCGGVSRNDFVVQAIANLIRKPVVRYKNIESSCLGAAFLAGLASGLWKRQEDLIDLLRTERKIGPQEEFIQVYGDAVREWKKISSLSLDSSS